MCQRYQSDNGDGKSIRGTINSSPELCVTVTVKWSEIASYCCLRRNICHIFLLLEREFLCSSCLSLLLVVFCMQLIIFRPNNFRRVCEGKSSRLRNDFQLFFSPDFLPRQMRLFHRMKLLDAFIDFLSASPAEFQHVAKVLNFQV